MKEKIKKGLSWAQTLAEVRIAVLEVLHQERKTQEKLGYVSGIITSDGPSRMKENIVFLGQYTESLRKMHPFPLFSAVDVFDEDVYNRIQMHKVSEDEWLYFWRDILKSGHVTDVFMTPRWEHSKGATYEYNVAIEFGLSIHYFQTS